MSLRIILHVDLDAFFAAVEEREHPEYTGKPVVVGADPKKGKGRGVVATCNYEARNYGIHSAMAISRAWQLCKDAIFLPVHKELYRKVSTSIMKILRSYADKFQQAGIDEAFLDISERADDFKEAEKLAKTIKEEVLKKEKLTCSIGIGPNKLVAKIASDFQKPDGLTVVPEKDAKQFFAPLQVDKLWGIGVRTKSKLNEMGIRTVGELANYDAAKLNEEFGAFGVEFHQMAQGLDTSEVIEYRPPKSFSREHTFDVDTSDKQLIYSTLDKLCDGIIKDANEHGYTFRTLTIKVRYEDFETHTSSKSFMHPLTITESVKANMHKLLKPFLNSGKAVRLIGVKSSNLFQKKTQKTLQIEEDDYLR